MTEGDVVALVRTHLYGPRGMKVNVIVKGKPATWSTGRDVKIIRKIRKDRPSETYEDIAAAIQGIGQMREDNWWGPQSRTMQMDMRVFFGRTKLDMPYYTEAKNRHFKSVVSGKRRGTWLSEYLRPLESKLQRRR